MSSTDSDNLLERLCALDLPHINADTVPHITRRRWSDADLHYLQTWVGTRSIRMLCHHLQRPERALRCKMHKLGLSGKVREGWDLKQLHAHYHLSAHAVLRHVAEGTLYLHCAEVRPPCSVRANVVKTGTAPSIRQYHALRLAPACPIGEIAQAQHQTIAQICTESLTGRYRLIHVRIKEDATLSLSSLNESRPALPLHAAAKLGRGSDYPKLHGKRRPGVLRRPDHAINLSALGD
jgi:hypothetical protein